MAAIRLHLVNVGAVDHRRRHQLSDAAATRILDGHRQRIDDTTVETDAQVWERLTSTWVQQLLDMAHSKRKQTLQDAAVSGIVKDTAPGEADVA